MSRSYRSFGDPPPPAAPRVDLDASHLRRCERVIELEHQLGAVRVRQVREQLGIAADVSCGSLSHATVARYALALRAVQDG